MGTDFYQVFFADSSGPILIVNVLKLINLANLSYTFRQKRRQFSPKKNGVMTVEWTIPHPPVRAR